MQFGSMPDRVITDALSVLRRMQEKYKNEKEKLYMCFVDIGKAFDQVQGKVSDRAMRRKDYQK